MTALSLMLVSFVGTYAGEGAWYDSASETKPYKVDMTIETLSEGKTRLWFKHLFYEENNSVIEQTIDFTPEPNGFFSISLVGTPLGGSGYCTSSTCHYTISLPDNTIEVTYIFNQSGEIKIVGSATRNAQGRRIWWEENVTLATPKI